MKKIILVILTILLIPFFIFIISTEIDKKPIFISEELSVTNVYDTKTLFNINNNVKDDYLLDLDKQISGLNNNTLNDIFVDTSLLHSEQLVTNGDFSDGTTGWTLSSATQTTSNGIVELTALVDAFVGLYQNILTINDKYYYNVSIKPNIQNSIRIGNGIYNITFELNQWNVISLIETAPNTIFRVYQNLLTNQTFQVDYAYTFNISTLIVNKQYSPLYETTFDLMTDEEIKIQMDEFVQKPYLFIDYETLGIDYLSTSEMDYLYTLYQSLLNPTPLPNEIENNFYTNDLDIIYIPHLSNQYSPIYEDTFNNLLELEIKEQLDHWLDNNLAEWQDYTTLNWFPTQTELEFWIDNYFIIEDYQQLNLTPDIFYGTLELDTYNTFYQFNQNNKNKKVKVYLEDTIDDKRYKLVLSEDTIRFLSEDNKHEFITLYNDDNFTSSTLLSELTYTIEGYEAFSYEEGMFSDIILAFFWIIPILLVGGFIILVFKKGDE